MSQPLSIERQRELISDLQRSIAERAEIERRILQQRDEAHRCEERRYQTATDELVHRFQSVKSATEAEYTNVPRKVVSRFETDSRTVDRDFQKARARALKNFKRDKSDAKRQLQEARWEAATLYEANKPRPRKELARAKAKLNSVARAAEELRGMAVSLLKQRRMWRVNLEEPATLEPPVVSDALASDRGEEPSLETFLSLASDQLERIRAQRLPRLFSGGLPLGGLLLLWLLLAIPCGAALGWANLLWIPVSVASAFVLAAVIGVLLFPRARNQAATAFARFKEPLDRVARGVRKMAAQAEADCKNQEGAILKQRDDAVTEAEAIYARAKSAFEYEQQREIQSAGDQRRSRVTELELRREQEHNDAESTYPRLLREIDERRITESKAIEHSHDQRLEKIRLHFIEQENQLRQRWHEAIARFQSGVAEMHACEKRFFHDFSADTPWTPPKHYPPAMKFGSLSVDLARIPNGIPSDPSLKPDFTRVEIPAVVPFPESPSLLFLCHDRGRDEAVTALQAMMLRLLTSLPPAQLRFTVIDPVGLGDNFSAFMHLADFDEKLITNNIWVESAHIEQRLADLTDHISSVIQKYLRSEFRSIQQYNEQAGEVAEPYRVVVVANFPAHFTESSARRLVSIANSGARCGVFTLVSVDTKQRMPHNFNLEDLQAQATCLTWNGKQFAWTQPVLNALPLELDAPPRPEAMVNLIRTVAEVAERAGRVEVPFDVVVPPDDQLWSLDARAGIDVPLGRAGAAKLQHLRLGKGTSQHVLIAGKTGSGKSTLLHALITNAALCYSPDEVEFYLVDFKKGVEFKAYATWRLPHARVIAIESEREFGLSVLQRLDLELQQRGDLFRDLGVQDLKAFRAAKPDTRMPRILLIIDEFQELFVEDDRLAQEASLLLDRLVRQGRAFGIHVLLGSQTLAGAYSLARSTLGQMAVRIALQCSDADAHLILSEENTAARLLSRPGEAIYNDANGLFEGNHPFQVVWLSDERREHYLRRVREMADGQSFDDNRAVVFEGNVPADITRNAHLKSVLEEESPSSPHAPIAWLGDAVAIKDPTAVEFARQGGSNLLVVGQQPEAALGMMAAALVSLAAARARKSSDDEQPGARFYIFDGARPDMAAASELWRTFAEVFPRKVTIVTPRECPRAITEIADALKSRQQAGDENAPSLYIMLYDLARFRDLRREEDEFSFSSMDDDKPPSASKQFAEILREGSPLGIHVLAWCDSSNNLTRWLDRSALREFEFLVALQMSANDSSNLIDTPAASKLGLHRGLLADLSQGSLEKFRPYDVPTRQWMRTCTERIDVDRKQTTD